MSEDVECPYCEKWLDICHDDGFGYEENVLHEQECPHCEKQFVFSTSISFYFEAKKADCLNGVEHEYKRTHTYPEEFSQMECTMCDDKREMTDQERAEFGIDTKQSYFDKL